MGDMQQAEQLIELLRDPAVLDQYAGQQHFQSILGKSSEQQLLTLLLEYFEQKGSSLYPTLFYLPLMANKPIRSVFPLPLSFLLTLLTPCRSFAQKLLVQVKPVIASHPHAVCDALTPLAGRIGPNVEKEGWRRGVDHGVDQG